MCSVFHQFLHPRTCHVLAIGIYCTSYGYVFLSPVCACLIDIAQRRINNKSISTIRGVDIPCCGLRSQREPTTNSDTANDAKKNHPIPPNEQKVERNRKDNAAMRRRNISNISNVNRWTIERVNVKIASKASTLLLQKNVSELSVHLSGRLTCQ